MRVLSKVVGKTRSRRVKLIRYFNVQDVKICIHNCFIDYFKDILYQLHMSNRTERQLVLNPNNRSGKRMRCLKFNNCEARQIVLDFYIASAAAHIKGF